MHGNFEINKVYNAAANGVLSVNLQTGSLIYPRVNVKFLKLRVQPTPLNERINKYSRDISAFKSVIWRYIADVACFVHTHHIFSLLEDITLHNVCLNFP